MNEAEDQRNPSQAVQVITTFKHERRRSHIRSTVSTSLASFNHTKIIYNYAGPSTRTIILRLNHLHPIHPIQIPLSYQVSPVKHQP
ncbi:hypothetical protein DM02DRAFT_360982 [Periconia macrospinosa]|uniref:Uncharacterized protein n=1 Tax=Periconia macrospinosa TaxID=97972 RepID=A0A2V1CZU5_9PLEO|nr:hypothetical protein DM02DRAFT_360982 [Periconia macrospinosa]